MEILKGTCEFVVTEEVSKKSGNKYNALKLKFKDYELSSWILLNKEQLYLINKLADKK